MSFPNRTILLGSLILPIIVIAVAVLSLLPSDNQSQNLKSDQILVAATIFPLSDIVTNIGGDRVQIVPLLPPGASPHSFSLSPRQLAQLQQSKTLFIIGHELDNWAAQTVSRTVDIPVFTVDDKIPLQELAAPHDEDEEDESQAHEAGSVDPHYWLTAPNAKQIALNISAELQKIDPEYTSQYAAQTENYLKQLDLLEQDLQSQAKGAANKEFIAIHNAWSYFAKHYGFKPVATYEPIEGKSPSINDLRELQSTIEEHNIKTFYTEPQKQSTAATRFVTDDLGLEINVLDPVGGIPPRDSYIDLMRYNMNTLTGAKK